MDYQQIRLTGDRIIQSAGLGHKITTATNFLDFANLVRDIVGEWSNAALEKPETKNFLLGLRKMRDNLAQIIEADPPCMYIPAHHVAREFHQSDAKVRYFRGGNGISKTQSGCQDNYWVATSQHPWRPHPPIPANVAIVGVNFSKYAPAVFEKKYLDGEPGNPLSPMFPEGGKWFRRYDEKKHVIELGCPSCANAGKSHSCRHPSSSVILLSDTEGAHVFQGAAYAQIQLDEQIRHEFWGEGLKRLERVLNSGMIVTETPLKGPAHWTHQTLTKLAEGPPEKNQYTDGRTFVSLHHIDQFSAGIVPHEEIRASMLGMTEPEIQARVYGLPVAASEHAVFDLVTLLHARRNVKQPARGNLEAFAVLEDGTQQSEIDLVGGLQDLIQAHINIGTKFVPFEDGPLRIWEAPQAGSQYIIGADVAKGLTKKDASAASVLKLTPRGDWFDLELVAQYHDWVNPIPYGKALYKLGLWYNEATLAIERNGPGDSVIYHLTMDLACWFVMRDLTSPSNTRASLDPMYGIDTNVLTKGTMISIAQQALLDRKTGHKALTLYCAETIGEMEAYIQEPTESGLNFRFRADGTAHDDRVMSIALGAYGAKVYPLAYDTDRALQYQRQIAQQNVDEYTNEVWADVKRQRAREDNFDSNEYT